jgi:hypothetical protein
VRNRDRQRADVTSDLFGALEKLLCFMIVTLVFLTGSERTV